MRKACGSLLSVDPAKSIGVVVKGYPRLSETFMAQELRELERDGFKLEIISLRRPKDKHVHPVHREIKAGVHYLPEYLHEEPARVFRAWRIARRLPGYRRAFNSFLADLRRDFTRNRLRRFGQGLVLAAEYAPRLSFLYVHFIHTPASAARYGAQMTGLDWAVSAHARDIWTSPGWELAEKLAECRWCVTCTAGGRDELVRHAPDPSKVHLVYHGLDLSRFPPPPEGLSARDGSDAANPIRFLTVGRAVAKKGIDTLIDALALLPPQLNWRWTHIGGGELKEQITAQAASLGLSDRCRFLGSKPQEEVLNAYRENDLFVLPCRIDETGDRDGLPNVMVEAQSQRVAVLTTPVSGITELIVNGENGVLVDPDDPKSLAREMTRLARDPTLRARLGADGENKVRSRFDHRATIGALEALLAGEAGVNREAAQ
jgi:glycosyltransferase involved in cell wall biosynthesis